MFQKLALKISFRKPGFRTYCRVVDLCSSILLAVPVHADPGPVSLAVGIWISDCIFIFSNVKYGFSLYCLLTCSKVGRKGDFWTPTVQEIPWKVTGVKNSINEPLQNGDRLALYILLLKALEI